MNSGTLSQSFFFFFPVFLLASCVGLVNVVYFLPLVNMSSEHFFATQCGVSQHSKLAQTNYHTNLPIQLPELMLCCFWDSWMPSTFQYTIYFLTI